MKLEEPALKGKNKVRNMGENSSFFLMLCILFYSQTSLRVYICQIYLEVRKN